MYLLIKLLEYALNLIVLYIWFQMDVTYANMRNDDIRVAVDLAGIVVLTVSN